MCLGQGFGGMIRIQNAPVNKRLLLGWFVMDAAGLLFSLLAASFLALHGHLNRLGAVDLVNFLLACAVILPYFVLKGLYSVRSRYLGIHDVAEFIGGLLIGTVAVTVSSLLMREPGVDVLLKPALFFCMSVVVLGLERLTMRRIEHLRHQSDRLNEDAKPARRTLLIGAGDAADMVLRELERMASPPYELLGILDDDVSKHGTSLRRVKVYGPISSLEKTVSALDVQQVLIAIPSANGEKVKEIVTKCHRLNLQVVCLPGLGELMHGQRLIPQVREVSMSDLLRRKQVQVDRSIGYSYIAGETVLITGGGGSIGSELARQVMLCDPKTLIILGKGENSIYEAEQSLIRTYGAKPICVIGDVRDRARMEAIFKQHQPTIVFHAAAHKHVPLMEANPGEAIRNNVLGTLNIVDLSNEFSVKKCILISTDKAVEPANVMGATKRLAELVVAAKSGKGLTHFGIVRFGNVLGSRGSLFPTLNAQIEHGGPVTVTHPDMTRFFMTIPEAVSLVIVAGAKGIDGETYILDMGEPIRILDIAEDLIKLHGYTPYSDINIKFTGPRPGEKLHEILAYGSEDLAPTDHPKVRVVRGAQVVEWEKLEAQISQLLETTKTANIEETKQALLQLVRTYDRGGQLTPSLNAVIASVDSEISL